MKAGAVETRFEVCRHSHEHMRVARVPLFNNDMGLNLASYSLRLGLLSLAPWQTELFAPHLADIRNHSLTAEFEGRVKRKLGNSARIINRINSLSTSKCKNARPGGAIDTHGEYAR